VLGANNDLNRFDQIGFPVRKPKMGELPHANSRLDEQIRRALNKIKKPSTAEEITDLLNRDLGPKDRPFQVEEVSTWLRNAGDRVLNLYWLANRPRR
jgi:hypothetical protein